MKPFGSNFKDALEKSLDEDLFAMYKQEFDHGTSTPESVKQLLDIQVARSLKQIPEQLFYLRQDQER